MTAEALPEAPEVEDVKKALRRYGESSIVVLSGVPGTGKSWLARKAALAWVTEPIYLREVQFHPAFSYQEWMEGLRPSKDEGLELYEGSFAEWNRLASDDPKHQYVLLIEELTRASVAEVLGELLTYIEHRNRAFHLPYSGTPTRIARNLRIIATMNPHDRSAQLLDTALLRRLFILRCPPSHYHLSSMLKKRGFEDTFITRLWKLFAVCHEQDKEGFADKMPFGHAVFASLTPEDIDDQLYDLWHGRLAYLLHPPGRAVHPYAQHIAEHYPWKTRTRR